MPKFNEQLARNAIKAIERNPEEWEQEAYRCETGMCFAGFVAFEAGARWANPSNEYDPTVIAPDGRIMNAADFALEALGFSDRDSAETWEVEDELFGSTNTLDDLKQKVDELTQ